MKKVVIALLVIAIVALGAVSLVGCEKSLDGTYVYEENNEHALVIKGDKISYYTYGELKDGGTFTRNGDVLTTTLTFSDFMNEIKITEEGKLTYLERKEVFGKYVTLSYAKTK